MPRPRRLSGILLVATLIVLVSGLVVDIPFYAYGIHRAEWWLIEGSQLDWKNLAPFRDSSWAVTALSVCFISLPFTTFGLSLAAIWRIRRASGARLAQRVLALATSFAVMLPWFLHQGRLVPWYLD